MSFSGMVKEELSRQISTARHCRIAEIAALLSACGKMTAAGILRFQTENDAVVRKYFTLLQKTFNIETEIAIRESRQMKKGNVYYVEITDPGQVETVLQGTKLSVNEGDGETLYTENALLTQQSCCKRAFIRGAFLASGSISDPEKGYHFEIVTQDERKATHLQEIICSFQIDAKIVLRKKSYVVYVKEGAQIVDMLAIMEANVALMNLENIRILKEMRNSVNRKVNCETANINKTVNAAVKQIEDIRLIKENTENLIVCAQSMDSLTPGRGMGYVLPESLKEAGAGAVFLNHAENQKTVSELYATIKRAKELGMITIVCADSTVEAKAVACMDPDIVLAEPTDLIGTGQVADDSYTIETVKDLHEVNPDVLVMIASGVSTAEDCYNVVKLGADGTGATSGILNAPSPAQRVQEMAEAIVRAKN